MDDAKVHDNQRELGAARTQDTTSIVEFEPLTCMSDASKTLKSNVRPKSMVKKCHKTKNRSTVKKHQKTNNKTMVYKDVGVNSTATNQNVT
jgi:hypothetical protein